MKNIFLAALLMCCVGCTVEVRKYTIDHVGQVMYVQDNIYRIFVVNEKTKEVKPRQLCGTITLIADAPENEEMWVDADEGMSNTYIIHIHTAKEITLGNTPPPSDD